MRLGGQRAKDVLGSVAAEDEGQGGRSAELDRRHRPRLRTIDLDCCAHRFGHHPDHVVHVVEHRSDGVRQLFRPGRIAQQFALQQRVDADRQRDGAVVHHDDDLVWPEGDAHTAHVGAAN
jgi:hypothetical protein